MTIEEFLNEHSPKSGKDPWYDYCEIIVTKDGDIFEAIPSHAYKLADLYQKKFNVTHDDINELLTKYDLAVLDFLVSGTESAAIWYSFGIAYPGYKDNKKVMRILNALNEAELIAPDTHLHYQEPLEYQMHKAKLNLGWYEMRGVNLYGTDE